MVRLAVTLALHLLAVSRAAGLKLGVHLSMQGLSDMPDDNLFTDLVPRAIGVESPDHRLSKDYGAQAPTPSAFFSDSTYTGQEGSAS